MANDPQTAPGDPAGKRAVPFARPLEWPGALDLLCRAALVAVLLWSGVAKALDYPATLVAVHGYRVVPAFLEPSLAAALPAAEIALALLLLLGLHTRIAAWVAAFLFAVFLAAMTQALLRDLTIGCGCFAGGSALTWFDLLRDLPLLAAALYVALRRDGPLRLDGLACIGPADPGFIWRLRIAAPAAAVAAVVAVALAASGLMGSVGSESGAVHTTGSVRSEPLPAGTRLPDFSAPALGGGRVSWASYRGTPVVLVVWAPWCSECEAELPRLVSAVERHPAIKLTSIATAVRQGLGPTPAAYMRTHGYGFPVALDSEGQRLADVLGVSGFPVVYYVRSDGVIFKVTIGAAPQHLVDSLMAAIAG